jgi:hypothetical protein
LINDAVGIEFPHTALGQIRQSAVDVRLQRGEFLQLQSLVSHMTAWSLVEQHGRCCVRQIFEVAPLQPPLLTS